MMTDEIQLRNATTRSATALFLDWLAAAKRGSEFIYFTGHLAAERQAAAAAEARREDVSDSIRARLDSANDAWRAYQKGRCVLTQRRVGAVGDACWQYVAVKA